MKKTIVTAMLFFAFLVVGIQSASAQYVNNDTASDLLETEIQTLLDDPSFDKETSSTYMMNKLNLFTFVNERIEAGSTVGDAIKTGVMLLPSNAQSTGTWVTATPNPKNPQLTVLHQELEDLLSQ